MLDLLELLGLKGITPSQNQPLQEPIDMEVQPGADASGLVTPEPLKIETPAAVMPEVSDHPHSFSADWHAEPLPAPTVVPKPTPVPAPIPDASASGFLQVDPNEPFDVGPKPYTSSVIPKPDTTSSPFAGTQGPTQALEATPNPTPEIKLAPLSEPTVAPTPTLEPAQIPQDAVTPSNEPATTVAPPDIKYS